MTVTPTKQRQRRKPPHSGIVAAARELGVTREHLYLVITGRRTYPKLAARYLRLMRKKSQPRPAPNPATL